MLVFHGAAGMGHKVTGCCHLSVFVVFLHAHLPQCWELKQFVTVPKKQCQSWFRTNLDESKPGAPIRKQNLLYMEKVEETVFSGAEFPLNLGQYVLSNTRQMRGILLFMVHVNDQLFSGWMMRRERARSSSQESLESSCCPFTSLCSNSGISHLTKFSLTCSVLNRKEFSSPD